MAYATVAQVKSEFKSLSIDANTPVTTDEVTEFIVQSDNEINTWIGTKYTVPISASTSPIATITVRQLSIWLTAHRIQGVTNAKSAVQEVNQEGEPISKRVAAMNILEKIQKGELTLVDAELSSTEDGVADFNSGNTANYTPLFDMEKEQF